MKRIHGGIPPIDKTKLIPEPHGGNDTFGSIPGGDIAGYHQPLERIKDTECIAGPSRRKSATPLQATPAGPIARPPPRYTRGVVPLLDTREAWALRGSRHARRALPITGRSLQLDRSPRSRNRLTARRGFCSPHGEIYDMLSAPV